MKRINLIPVLLLLTVIGCKDPATAPPTEPLKNYLPVLNGSRFVYQVDSVTATGLSPIGIRVSVLGGTASFYGTPYVVQRDTLIAGVSPSVSLSYVRTTPAGAYYFYDNAPIRALIPDSLKPFISFDEEALVFSYPAESGRQWYGYKVIAGTTSFISLRAVIGATDTLRQVVNGNMSAIPALKVSYTMVVNLPPQLFPGSEPVEYSGDAWFAQNIGMVKLRGNAQLFALIGGGQVPASGAGLITEQRLTGYALP